VQKKESVPKGGGLGSRSLKKGKSKAGGTAGEIEGAQDTVKFWKKNRGGPVGLEKRGDLEGSNQRFNHHQGRGKQTGKGVAKKRVGAMGLGEKIEQGTNEALKK